VTQDVATSTIAEKLFTGGGELGALMRSYDWSQTSLGLVENWSQSLKTAVRIMLTSRQPMFVWWGKDLINLYNDAYKAILGGKHPEALGQPASYVWREIWDQVGPRAESALLKNEGTYDEALLLIMERNGYPEETYYTFSYSPVPNDQGQTSGIICANSDDTQRIVGERQLTLLRELAAKTVDARTFDEACMLSANCLGTNLYDLPFAMIYLVDPEHQCAVLAGTSGVERGHSLAPETVAFEDDSVWPFAAVLTSHQVCLISDLDRQFDLLPLGGWQRSPYQAVAVPISPSGQTGKAGILVAGLNPFRLFDDNYRRFIDLVAAQIAASIANAQAYEEERKRAEALAEIDRAKTVFFSNVSHEFRTPLTLILGPLEDTLNSSKGLDPVDREQLETVHRNSLRLLKLVNTLLDFSRIEAGRVQAVYEPTDLAMLTADLAGMFRSAIERAGVRLRVDCPPLPEPVYVDREMWEKIVLNLLSNAFKFTFEGEIAVILRCLESDTGTQGHGDTGNALRSVSPCVVLEVRDTGIGIPADELPHIFERFHRVQGAKGRTYEGSGIGLSFVQELVRLHGGTIQVSSVINQGTSLTISLPTGCAHLPSEQINATPTLNSTATGAIPFVAEALRWLPQESPSVEEWMKEEEPPPSSLPPLHPSIPPRATVRILLADDNADMRHYVQRLLSQRYEVEAVSNGMAALAAVRQRLPDLVLTDVMMPELDGFELLRQLRTDPQTQELPIILLSARAGEESCIEGLEAGADDYLIKPFSARELLARVEANLKLAQLRQEVTRHEQVQRREVELAKQQLESVLSSISDQFLVLDQEWRYVYVNDRVIETLGLSREALIGRTIWEIFPGIVGSEFDTQVRRAIAEQTPVHFEYFYPTWNRWFEIHAYPASDGLTFLITEITDRKRAEEALLESEERFRNMADNAPMMVWVTDPMGDCTYLSKSWCEFTGQTETAGQGSGWIEAVHPDDRNFVSSLFQVANEHYEPFQIEYRLRRKDGEYRWAIDAAAPWFGVDGQFKGYIGSVMDISDRRQIEETLRQRETELRLVTNAVPALISFVDVDQRYRFNNRGYEEWFGRSGTAVYGKHLQEVLGEAGYAKIRPYVEQVLTGQPVNFENQVMLKNGELRDVNITYVPRSNERGVIQGFVALITDISDRKRMEQALRDSENRFRLIVESAKDYAIFTLDLNGNVTIWNSGAQRLLGYTEAEIIGQPEYIIFTPDDRHQWQVERKMRLALSQGRAENERWYMRQDGSCFWGSGLMMPLQDEAKRTHGFLKILQDKTAERQAAQALQEGSDRLRLLYETVSDLLSNEQPMTLMDTLFRKLSAQMELHCYYHFTMVERNHRPMLHLLHHGGIPTEQAEDLAWIEFGQALCGLVARDRRQLVLNQAQLLTHPNAQGVCSMGFTAYAGQPLIVQGRLLGTLSFLSYTRTEFTAAEIDLLQAISDQVAVALDRATLVNSLQQQKEQLIQANRIKDEFLAIVSHELRTPLNPILGWSKLLQTKQLDPAKTAHALSTIGRNAKLQAELIEDLLDISRILRGKLSLNVDSVDLALTIQSAMETVQLAAEAKSIQIQTQFEPNIGQVSGDSSRLQQVVWNLLSNAIKFTPEGGRVAVRLERIEPGQADAWTNGRVNENAPLRPPLCSYAQITVTDTGKGIHPSFLPHVFDYFRQEDSATTRKFGGLGLGLTIVHHLVELHGGTVQAESPGEGQGATFTLKLPLMPTLPMSHQPGSLSEPALDLTGLQILVVDDDVDSREFVLFLVEQYGARVLSAASADEALVVLTHFQPDVLLSDIGMPEVDGYALMQQVRALPPEQGGQIPAIALTAYAGEIDYQQAISAGFQRHISKPVEPEVLIQAIVNLVEQMK
jgi:PAS domain S-box-containing protein